MFSQQLKSDLFALSEHNLTKFVVFFLVVFSQVFHYQFWFNEYDVLPTIYSQTDSSWLAHDWYLSLDIGYRFIFNNLTGPIANLLGFQYGSYTIRIILYALFIAAYIRFVNTIKLGLFFSTITLLFVLPLSIAGIWRVDGRRRGNKNGRLRLRLVINFIHDGKQVPLSTRVFWRSCFLPYINRHIQRSGTVHTFSSLSRA